MKHLLLFTAASLLFAGCGSDQKPTTKVLEIFGIDWSLSVKDFKLPDAAFIREVIKTHLDQGDEYTISVAPIAESTDRPILVAHFPSAPRIDNTAPPSQRDRQRKAADSIRWDNLKRLDEFIKLLEAEVFSGPATAPLTDLNGFLAKAETLLSESTFRDSSYTRRVVLISDCLQDVEGTDQDVLTPHFQQSPPFTLFLIGCKQPGAFSGLTVEKLQSIDGLLLFLQNNHFSH